MSSMQQPSMHPGAGPHPSMGMPPTSMQSMPPAGPSTPLRTPGAGSIHGRSSNASSGN